MRDPCGKGEAERAQLLAPLPERMRRLAAPARPISRGKTADPEAEQRLGSRAVRIILPCGDRR